MPVFSFSIFRIFITGLLCLLPSLACAWGERGHDLITRVAVRLIDESPGLKTMAPPFRHKSLMLGHLANIPDVYWRSLPKTMTSEGNPSHYIDIEYLYKNPKSPTDIRIDTLIPAIKELCVKYNYLNEKDCNKASKKILLKQTGSAPWRIEQFINEMTAQLTEISKLQNRKTGISNAALNDKTNKALLYAGLVSHFIGDLGQPLHTTINYDGQLTKQKGIHAYFETMMIQSADFKLDHEVYLQAKTIDVKTSIDEFYKKLPNSVQKSIKNNDPRIAAFALTMVSHEFIDRLLSLDKKFFIIPTARELKMPRRIEAERAKDQEAAKKLLVECLARSSAFLKYFWVSSWEQAGKPNLRSYKSYHYHLRPEFIRPNYLD